MNDLHRELAPIPAEAWEQIDAETSRTIRGYLAGRRIADVHGPDGLTLAAIGTGRLVGAAPLVDGVQTWHRQVLPLVQLRVPFTLSRAEIDSVGRGSADADWSAARAAARQMAMAEDITILSGYPAASITGILTGTTHPQRPLPEHPAEFPRAFAAAVGDLRAAGVDGPYAAVLSPAAYTAAGEATDHGYPILRHLRDLLDGGTIWAPAITGAAVVSLRGGDFSLHLGQDLSIGYESHSVTEVTLYLQESFTFQLVAGEAAVAFTAA
jgi:uncharacterized linocin/CFP29 family protein